MPCVCRCCCPEPSWHPPSSVSGSLVVPQGQSPAPTAPYPLLSSGSQKPGFKPGPLSSPWNTDILCSNPQGPPPKPGTDQDRSPWLPASLLDPQHLVKIQSLQTNFSIFLRFLFCPHVAFFFFFFYHQLFGGRKHRCSL